MAAAAKDAKLTHLRRNIQSLEAKLIHAMQTNADRWPPEPAHVKLYSYASADVLADHDPMTSWAEACPPCFQNAMPLTELIFEKYMHSRQCLDLCTRDDMLSLNSCAATSDWMYQLLVCGA